MRYVLALLVLFAKPAYADTPPCYPAKETLSALTIAGYLMTNDFEIESHAGMIMVNQDGDWVALVLMDEKTVCEMASGRAWHQVKERKA